MAIDIPSAIAAIGSLGTASFALVDTTKAFWGGVSNRGFGHIQSVLRGLFPIDDKTSGGAANYAAIRGMLRANWINGTALADQKSIAKTLIKIRLDATNAAHLAHETEVDAATLATLAVKYESGAALTPEEMNVAGRFDLLLTTRLDEAYQRADQAYRNSSKLLAVVFSVLLAIGGKLTLGPVIDWGVAILAGLLAAPLAPVSKDIASALQASVKTLQAIRK